MKFDKGLMAGSSTLLVLSLLEGGDMYGYQMIEELSPEMIYITPSLSNSERAMLRRSGTSFAEIDTSSVLRFNDDGSIQVISGEASYGQGIYVTCPHCGTMIYVTLPY